MPSYNEQSIYQKLLQLPLFQGLGSSEMTWIIDKIKFDFAKYQAGDSIIQQDSSCNAVVFILDGSVEMATTGHDCSYTFYEQIPTPAVLQPEVLFGPRTRYTHHFIATSNVGVLSISKSQFWEHLLQYDVFRMNYINLISAEAQNATRIIWQPFYGSVRQKIILFMVQHSWRPSGPKRLKIRMEDLSTQLGETRLNVSKALNELQELQLISLRRGVIEVPKLESLIALNQEA